MSDIKLIKEHSLPIAKAKALAQKAADALAAEYGITSQWQGNTLNFKRSGVDGQMHVTDSEIRLEIVLGFLLKAFKGTILEQIERNFEKLLPGESRTGATKATKKPRREVKKT